MVLTVSLKLNGDMDMIMEWGLLAWYKYGQTSLQPARSPPVFQGINATSRKGLYNARRSSSVKWFWLPTLSDGITVQPVSSDVREICSNHSIGG